MEGPQSRDGYVRGAGKAGTSAARTRLRANRSCSLLSSSRHDNPRARQ
jgi:hypothetical protein